MMHELEEFFPYVEMPQLAENEKEFSDDFKDGKFFVIEVMHCLRDICLIHLLILITDRLD